MELGRLAYLGLLCLLASLAPPAAAAQAMSEEQCTEFVAAADKSATDLQVIKDLVEESDMDPVTKEDILLKLEELLGLAESVVEEAECAPPEEDEPEDESTTTTEAPTTTTTDVYYDTTTTTEGPTTTTEEILYDDTTTTEGTTTIGESTTPSESTTAGSTVSGSTTTKAPSDDDLPDDEGPDATEDVDGNPLQPDSPCCQKARAGTCHASRMVRDMCNTECGCERAKGTCTAKPPKKCNPGEEEEAVLPEPPPPPPCQNDWDKCDLLVKVLPNICDVSHRYAAFAMNHCTKACGLCDCSGGDIDAGTCHGWANIGECKKNPKYMLAYCALSCCKGGPQKKTLAQRRRMVARMARARTVARIRAARRSKVVKAKRRRRIRKGRRGKAAAAARRRRRIRAKGRRLLQAALKRRRRSRRSRRKQRRRQTKN